LGVPSDGQYWAKTVEVGSFKPNAFGLHDMHGKVWEWAEDCYKDTYAGAPTDGSAVTSSGCTFRVLRGGSWDNYPWLLSSASRVGVSPRPPGLLCRLRLSAGQNVRYLIFSFWVEGVATGVLPQAVSQMPYCTAWRS
jgi:Sulfatase-modifying factor enzyme 1